MRAIRRYKTSLSESTKDAVLGYLVVILFFVVFILILMGITAAVRLLLGGLENATVATTTVVNDLSATAGVFR